MSPELEEDFGKVIYIEQGARGQKWWGATELKSSKCSEARIYQKGVSMGPRKLQASGVHGFGWCQERKGFDSQNIEALVVVAEKVCCQERKGLGSQKEKASVEKKGKAWVAKKEKDLADMKGGNL